MPVSLQPAIPAKAQMVATIAPAPFDGTYSGTGTPGTNNSVSCRNPISPQMTVVGGQLTYNHEHHALINATVEPSGKFEGSAQNLSAKLMVQKLEGTIQGNKLTGLTSNPSCTFTLDLTRAAN